jgi:hypothetical protein
MKKIELLALERNIKVTLRLVRDGSFYRITSTRTGPPLPITSELYKEAIPVLASQEVLDKVEENMYKQFDNVCTRVFGVHVERE